MESSFPPADNDNFTVFAGNLREWCEIRYIRVVPSLTLGLVWLFLVVANHADLAVLAQDMGKMRGICWVCGQFLLLSGPGKTPLPVRIAQNPRRWRMALNLLSSRAIPFICLQKTD